MRLCRSWCWTSLAFCQIGTSWMLLIRCRRLVRSSSGLWPIRAEEWSGNTGLADFKRKSCSLALSEWQVRKILNPQADSVSFRLQGGALLFRLFRFFLLRYWGVDSGPGSPTASGAAAAGSEGGESPRAGRRSGSHSRSGRERGVRLLRDPLTSLQNPFKSIFKHSFYHFLLN